MDSARLVYVSLFAALWSQLLKYLTDDIFNELAAPGFTTHKGTPGSGATFKYRFIVDNSKSLAKLGMTYRSMTVSARDLIEDMQMRRQYGASTSS